MSASLSLHSEFDGLRFEASDGTVWIRSRRGDYVALTLDARDLDQLQAAVNAARVQQLALAEAA